MYLQLIINPGSTSTKLALYRNEERLAQENITHDSGVMSAFHNIVDQIPMRMEIIHAFMKKSGVEETELSAVVARGGLVPGLKVGGYEVNDDLEAVLASSWISAHASNLGGLLARAVAAPLGIPAYIYDAPTSSELPPIARITGNPGIYRQSYCHALNSRAQAFQLSKERNIPYKNMRLLVAHMGGGISISVHEGGRIVETIGDDEGPFAPERSGSLPSLEIARLCYSGKYTEAEMKKLIRGAGGMYAYLGTSDCRVIEERIAQGDAQAELVFAAQAYQIAKGIGQMSVVLKGKCDAIILTGGLAFSKRLTDYIKTYVEFIAPVVVMPGENEMEALAYGGLRILRNEETAQLYTPPQE